MRNSGNGQNTKEPEEHREEAIDLVHFATALNEARHTRGVESRGGGTEFAIIVTQNENEFRGVAYRQPIARPGMARESDFELAVARTENLA